VPLGAGPGYTQGHAGGTAAIQLSIAQMPVHTHGVMAASTRGT
jgi:microcystin-dependent protein